jgi:hypothetical protein
MSVLRTISSLLGMMLVLSGCTAIYTTPLSMPIWLILGIVFIIRASVKGTWSCLATLCLIQLILITIFGLAGWLDDVGSANRSTANAAVLALGGASAAGLTFLSWRHGQAHADQRSARVMSVGLQLLATVIMVAMFKQVIRL